MHQYDIDTTLYDIKCGDKVSYGMKIVKFLATSFYKHPYDSTHQFLSYACVPPKGISRETVVGKWGLRRDCVPGLGRVPGTHPAK